MVNSKRINCVAFDIFIKTMIKASGHGCPTVNKRYIYTLRPIDKQISREIFNDQNQSGCSGYRRIG
jgi:hypothetical protein